MNDAGLPGSDAHANGATAFRPLIGVDFDAVQISLLVTGACDRHDGVRLGVVPAYPDNLEAHVLDGDPADFPE